MTAAGAPSAYVLRMPPGGAHGGDAVKTLDGSVRFGYTGCVGRTRLLGGGRMRSLSFRSLDRYRNIGLLFARGIPGVVYLYHGWQKLDGGLDGVSGFLDSLGVPLPDVMAFILTFGELIGGALLIIGLFTRLVAVLFIVEMTIAILLVRIDIGLIGPMGSTGAELDLSLIAAMFAVATMGPGSLSVDRNVGIEGRVLTDTRVA